MNLEYIEETRAFVLRVPRTNTPFVRELVQSHGWDMSLPRSTVDTALMFTTDAYAAAAFTEIATAEAREQLAPIAREVSKSWAASSKANISCPAGTELFPFQKAGVEYCMQRSHSLIGDQPGLGKCMSNDTPVWTTAGLTTMGQVCVGDRVFGSDGKPTLVTAKYPQKGLKECYRVTFQDGSHADCDAEQLWAVRDANRVRRGGGWTVKTLEELMRWGVHGADGKNKWMIPFGAALERDPLDLPVDPYVLGALIGDGYLAGSSVCLSVPPDKQEVLDEVLKRLPDVRTSEHNEWTSSRQVKFLGAGKHNPLLNATRDLGLDIKSSDRFIPLRYMFGSVGQRLDLLRGLMDTDGSAKRNRITFHTVSDRLTRDIRTLVCSLGGTAVIRPYDRGPKGIEFQVNVRLDRYCPFYLKRKALQWTPAKQNRQHGRYISGVEPIGLRPTTCIRVEAEDHLYVVGDGVVTHNTCQAICVANEMKAKRILVICPAAIRLQWIAKIREWTTLPWPYVLHPILKAGHGVHPNAHYTVVSYELASTAAIGAALADRTYDLLILDEAHYLKTIDTRRTRAVFGGGKDRKFEPLASRAGAVVALTGTPLPNRPREAYTLARGLCHEAIDFMSEQGFKDRYNPSMQITQNGKIVANREESGRSFELQNRLRAHFMVRREKHGERGVMKQLVLPVYDIVQLEKTGPVKLALEAESMLHLDPETLSGADAKILGHVAEVRRLMGVALAPQVADYADMLIDGGEEKLVIFGWHTEVLDILQQKLAKHGVVRIDGSTSARRRQENVAAFQHNPKIKVIIGNMLAMGVGVDGLQHCCNHVLLAEPDWVPGNNVQAIDRLDRGGQQRQVQADIFVAPSSFAERVLASALRKMQTIHKSLDARVQKIW